MALGNIEERLARLEAKVEMMLEELEYIKQRLDKLEEDVRVNGRKTVVTVLAMVLSFLAAVLGIKWAWG